MIFTLLNQFMSFFPSALNIVPASAGLADLNLKNSVCNLLDDDSL